MDQRPNIVLIFPDQMRGDSLGHLGHSAACTPYIDSLAAEGVSFRSAYSPSPSCIPARACLATGLSPWRCGRVGYEDGRPWPYRQTFMHLLRDSGYQTVQVGKTHFHPHRLHLGFEVNRLYEASVREPGFVSDYHSFLLSETGGKVRDVALDRNANAWTVEPWRHEERLHPTRWIADEAIAAIETRDPTRPLLLQVGLHRPHPPFDPPERCFDALRAAPLPSVAVGDWVDDVEPTTRSHVGQRHVRIPDHRLDEVRRAYFASVMHVDEQVGRLVAALKSSGMDRNTWIILTSDHGEFLGDHHLLHKFMPLEPAARIPLVVRPPVGAALGTAGNLTVPPGSVLDTPVLLTDVMPTILECAGVQVPPGLDGVSLIPSITAAPGAGATAVAAPTEVRRMLHIEHHGQLGGYQCLCDGRIKYIRDGLSGKEWYFDLTRDPTEMHDLSAEVDHSGFREQLVAILAPRQDGLVVDGRLATGVGLPPTAEWVVGGSSPQTT